MMAALRWAPLDAEAIEDRVLGTLRYTIDLELPGMLHAALVRSPVATGTVRDIDARAALAMPGVVRVVTPVDITALGLADERYGTMTPDQPLLAGDRIRHVGEPLASVLAETEAEALRAAASIRLSIDPGPRPLLDPDAALADGAPVLHDDRPGNVLARWGYQYGELAAAEAVTVARFEGTYSSPAAQHVTMEPQVCLAAWSTTGLEVWAATQSPDRIATELARILALDAGAVRLHVAPLGGGYGGKNHAKLEPLTAVLARIARRPVRLLDRRSDEFVTTTKHPARIHLVSGVDAEGRFTYRRADIRWSSGAYTHSSMAVVRGGAIGVCGPYRMLAAEVASTMVYTNLPPAGSFRGLGANQGMWAGERQVDEIATALGDDPVEFRRRNVVRAGDRLPTGEVIPEPHWLDCLDAVVDALGRRTPGRGTGVALAMKHTMTPSRSGVALVAHADGTLEVRSNLVDMGQGLRSVLVRAASEALGVDPAIVRVADPDTREHPADAGTFSSRGAWAGTVAVHAAAAELRGRLELPAVPTQAVLAEAVRATGSASIEAHGTAENRVPEVPEGAVPPSTSHWHQGAVAVEVTTDPGTGVVHVDRAAGAAWAGRVIDIGRARLQNEGGFIFGTGPALFESLDADAHGRPRTISLLDYRIPSILDLPDELTTFALEAADPRGEPTGIGESVIPAVAPAIAAAVSSTVRQGLRELPLTPERVLGIAVSTNDTPATVPPLPGDWSADAPMPLVPAAPPLGQATPHVLVIDGAERTVELDPLASLAQAIRMALGPGVVREPCGVGVCGGCTVRLAGMAVRSCLTPVGLVDGRPVETIAAVNRHDPVADALIGHGAAQCGSCLPGMVQALRSLLASRHDADERTIREGLAGNLCRCGSYGPIIEAALAVSMAGVAKESGDSPSRSVAHRPGS